MTRRYAAMRWEAEKWCLTIEILREDSVRCRCLAFVFFFSKKNRSSSSRRPERHANTKEVDISTNKRVRMGEGGPIVMS